MWWLDFGLGRVLMRSTIIAVVVADACAGAGPGASDMAATSAIGVHVFTPAFSRPFVPVASIFAHGPPNPSRSVPNGPHGSWGGPPASGPGLDFPSVEGRGGAG